MLNRDPLLNPNVGKSVSGGVPPATESRSKVTGLSAAQTDCPLFDPDEYEALAEELGPEGMAEAMSVFIDETSARLAKLRSLTLPADQHLVTREAHTLKGAAATFGFKRLSEIAGFLEGNAAAIEVEGLSVLSSNLETAFHHALAAEARLPKG